MTRINLLSAAAAATLAIAGCSGGNEPPIENEVTAGDETGNLADNGMGNAAGTGQAISFVGGDGSPLGSVTVSEGAGAVTLAISATGMPEGTHGLHLHEKGLCDGPKFESAGAHWNPTSKQHGRDNPAGAHMGDLDNLTIPASGTASASVTVAGGSMAAMADADGTSLVVHAQPDDYKTDPSGNSGDRIACAVIAPPSGQ